MYEVAAAAVMEPESLRMLIAQIESNEPGEHEYDARASRADMQLLADRIRQRKEQLKRELDAGW